MKSLFIFLVKFRSCFIFSSILLKTFITMGVQRKAAQVNWLASFGLIILAGTLYRLRKFNNAIFKTQMSDIM